MVIDIISNTRRILETSDEKKRVEPSPEIDRALKGLRAFMFEAIYQGPTCQEERSRAMFIIEHLFNYYKKNPHRMTPLYREIMEEEGLERAVADYISGMSDAYCISLFKEIYIPQSLVPDALNIFEGAAFRNRGFLT